MSVKEFLEIHLKLTRNERDNFYDFMRFRKIKVSREFVLSPLLGIPIVRVGWLWPPLNFTKFNSDAGFVEVDEKVLSSDGVTFRDSKVDGVFCTKFKNVNTPFEAELETFSFGLFLALRLGIPKLVAESDSLELVKAFGSAGIKLEHFDKFMKLPLEMLEDYRISHVLREGNFPAHILANTYDLANVGEEIDGGFNLAYDKEIDVDKTIDSMRKAFGRAYESFLKDYNRQVFSHVLKEGNFLVSLFRVRCWGFPLLGLGGRNFAKFNSDAGFVEVDGKVLTCSCDGFCTKKTHQLSKRVPKSYPTTA
ncbi:hypothetical protein Vadar_021735 [Vaccinium darrowii]|uniref:Uncharacterized protein n=1 Tax=Vaccinium darrowii TaxID=229202 RepID=A0ACB7YXM3_9ERIC|nr:hypothetical protein Vadar_021735 [Vaccinium darrowii]